MNLRTTFTMNPTAFMKLIFVFALATSCSQQKFTPINDSSANNEQTQGQQPEELQKSFPLQSVTQDFTQESLDENNSYLSFQIQKPDGALLTDLASNDFQILENNTQVKNFKFSKNSTQKAATVDIAFVIDVTGSMKSTIESAKLRLIQFIRKSRQAGYHTRMCLVTFGDYTVKKCDRFYDNNPDDPKTESDVQLLISEISKLQALTGALDPGGSDFNENPMRALIDAANADWQKNNQRFAILITDDGFLYSPQNQGNVGALAPYYSEVTQALTKSQMKVFAATPSLPGYNQKFKTNSKSEPGIVELSNGEWFKYADLVSGKITLDSILNRILMNVNTTFIAEYTVDEQDDLDAALPLTQREIKIVLKDGSLGKVIASQLKSNLPDGRKEYKKLFKLSDKKISESSIQVLIDQSPCREVQLTTKGEILFKKAPRKKAKIQVSYLYDNPADGLMMTPILLPFDVDTESLDITFNQIKVSPKFYNLTLIDKEQKISMTLNPEVFTSADFFKIKDQQKLDIVIKYKKKEISKF